jgi:hypothetical protein
MKFPFLKAPPVLVEIIICFGEVVRQGICESRFFLKLGVCE